MAFAIRANLRSAEAVADIRLICRALAKYTFDPARTAFTDFVPTNVLYKTYTGFVKKVGKSPALNPTQFGVAIRLAFAIDASRSCRRFYMGRKMMGYCHVRGPGSVVTREKAGNPNFGQSGEKVFKPVDSE